MSEELDRIDIPQREVTFGATSVAQWRNQSDDDADIHDRHVPSMMILDHVSSMVTAASDEYHLIPSGITAARFRDPVLVGEEVHISVEYYDSTKLYTSFDFEARVPERNSLVANGTFNVAVKEK